MGSRHDRKMTVNFDAFQVYFISLILPALGTINYELGVAAEYAWSWPGWSLLLAGFLGISLGLVWLANFTFIYSVSHEAKESVKSQSIFEIIN